MTPETGKAALAELETECARQRISLNAGRRAVLHTLLNSESEQDVPTLHRKLPAGRGKPSRSTVYKFLTELQKAGIAKGRDCGKSPTRYVLAQADAQGSLVDEQSATLAFIEDRKLYELQRLIAGALGYELVGYRLHLTAETPQGIRTLRLENHPARRMESEEGGVPMPALRRAMRDFSPPKTHNKPLKWRASADKAR